ncbi:MAG: hypothetical protein ACTSVY_03115 [Candidatus Helarchaeota archaeon]
MDSFSMFGSFFFWIDLSIGISFILMIFILYRLNVIDKFAFYLFWIGSAVGLIWEFPIFFTSAISNYPIITFLNPLPFHFSILIIIHSIWDGALFLFGVALIYQFSESPHFKKFNSRELIILIIWGQLQAIGIEMIGSFGGGWQYVPYWWNPPILVIFGRSFMLLIQLIWLAAVISFYFIALKLDSKISNSS